MALYNWGVNYCCSCNSCDSDASRLPWTKQDKMASTRSPAHGCKFPPYDKISVMLKPFRSGEFGKKMPGSSTKTRNLFTGDWNKHWSTQNFICSSSSRCRFSQLSPLTISSLPLSAHLDTILLSPFCSQLHLTSSLLSARLRSHFMRHIGKNEGITSPFPWCSHSLVTWWRCSFLRLAADTSACF